MLYSYAALRVVPRVDRGDGMNAGVILFCQDARVLACRTRLDEARLRAMDPAADVAAIAELLVGLSGTCEGRGPARAVTLGQRFRWLAAPRSTVLQTGPVHGGLTDDPRVELDRLFDAIVGPAPASSTSGETVPSA